ncbi:MAG: hypothetical protein ABI333_18530 [bacterium]
MVLQRIGIAALLAFAVALVHCNKKQAAGGGGGGMAADMSMDEPMDGPRLDPMKKDPGTMVVQKLTTGPTGIAECDNMLDIVCRCQKKHPSLKVACGAVMKDAPGWKAKAQKQDPKQIGELATACVRTLKEIQSSFDCK